MEQALEILKNNMLFKEMTIDEMRQALNCLSVYKKNYKKDEIIYLQGSHIDQIGIVLDGELQIINDDIMGGRTIIAKVVKGELFGEAYACMDIEHIPITVLSKTNSQILFMNYKHIVTTCSNACVFHHRLIENMLQILAFKSVQLNEKMDCLSKRSIREKVMAYLLKQGQKCESPSFEIPFNRQEMADYLCIDRSALSSELGKLKKDGIIDYKKNHFELLSEDNNQSIY